MLSWISIVEMPFTISGIHCTREHYIEVRLYWEMDQDGRPQGDAQLA